ncbi:unnamed protein product [Cuscuta campestris]|uniref:Uncharacterized protein n=1 Tax=Cuscuta campestris TaxID=132261 RepID=A0A484LL72_9ASTE|nr:unnamed protein product [Cuscuta campestris]
MGEKQQWSNEQIKCLLETCIEEVNTLGRKGLSLHKESWNKLGRVLKERFGLDLSQKQMRNAYDNLKAKYSGWVYLKNKTGNIYNAQTNTFTLTNEEWEDFKKGHPKAGSLKTVPLPFPELCAELFDGNAATGMHKWTSTQQTSLDASSSHCRPKPLLLQNTVLHEIEDDVTDTGYQTFESTREPTPEPNPDRTSKHNFEKMTGHKYTLELLQGNPKQCTELLLLDKMMLFAKDMIVQTSFNPNPNIPGQNKRLRRVFKGVAHDARILSEALSDPHAPFPIPPPDKYYLCDAAYGHTRGFMAPYRNVRKEGLSDDFFTKYDQLNVSLGNRRGHVDVDEEEVEVHGTAADREYMIKLRDEITERLMQMRAWVEGERASIEKWPPDSFMLAIMNNPKEEEEEQVKLPVLKRGFWTPEEDLVLKKCVQTHGEGNWATISTNSGLMRSGKSCRLRWKNYLRPNIKRGMMSDDEKDLIIRMHKLLGNRWSLIAGRLPGRTDNEVKNFWNTHLNKRCRRGGKKARTTPPKDGEDNTSADSTVVTTPRSTGKQGDQGRGGKQQQEEEMSSIMNSWMEHMGIMDMMNNCTSTSLGSSPVSTNDLPLVFEAGDAPLVPIWDDILLEAFRSTGDETLLDAIIHPFLLL